MGVLERYQEKENRSRSNVESRYIMNSAIPELVGRINTLQGRANNLANQYNNRYLWGQNGNRMPVQWRADSADWLSAVSAEREKISADASSLADQLLSYKDIIDEDTYRKGMDALDAVNGSSESIFASAKQENDIFSRFQNADEYNKAIRLNNQVANWDQMDDGALLDAWNNANHNLTIAYMQDNAEAIDQAEEDIDNFAAWAASARSGKNVGYMASEWLHNRDIQRLGEIDAERNKARQQPEQQDFYSAPATDWAENRQVQENAFELEKEYQQLKARIARYESHDQKYNRAMSVTGNKDFGEISAIQNDPKFKNPSKEELDAYDKAVAPESGYAVEGAIVNPGQESAYSKQRAKSPIIVDPLGMYLNASDEEKAQAAEMAVDSSANTWAKAIARGQTGRWDYMREDDVAAYYYVLNTEGTEAANKFLEDISTRLVQREATKAAEDLENAPTDEIVAAAALSILAKPFISAINAGQMLGAAVKGDYYDPNLAAAPGIDKTRAELGIRANKSAQDAKIFDVSVGDIVHAVTGMEVGELLNTGFSLADSTFTTSGFGSVGTLVLGMDAAKSTAEHVYEIGGTKEQIFASAVMAGTAEAVFEYLSFDRFAENVLDGNYHKASELFKQAAIQGGVEASEEVFTEIANTISNGIIMGHMSDYNISKNAYIDAGYTKQEAEAKATTDVLTNIWTAAVGGFLSGGVRTAVSGTPQLIRNRYEYNAKNQVYATEIIENKMVDRTIASAQTTLAQLKEGSGQYKRLNAAIEAVQKEASVKNVQELLRQFDIAVTSVAAKDIDEMAPAIGKDEAKQLKRTMQKSGENLAVAQMAADEELAKKAVEHNLKTGTGTVDLKTGNDIKIEGVYRTREKGNPTLVFKLADGSTIKYDDVSYSSNATAAMAQVISETGIRADYATSLLNSASDENGLDAAGVRDAILSGMIGEAVKTARHAGMSYALTDAQFKTAYEAGKMLANDKLNREIGLASQKTVPTAQTENKGGKVVGQFYDGTEGAVLRSTTKAQIRTVEMIAKAINATVEIYASSVVDGVRQFTDRRGAVHKGNAAYIPGINTIVIDINAGNALNGLVLNSLAHEVVHFIKDMAPDKFRKLADFVVGKFGEKGKSVTSLILAKQKTYRMQGHELSFMDAYEEVVADSVESMFSQKADKIVADIAEMRKVDADLAKTFVDKIKDTFKKMLSVFKENDFQPAPDSEEGKFFAEWTEVQDELAHLFAEGAAAAADRVATAAKQSDSALTKENTPAEAGVKNMYRGKLSDGTSVYETGYTMTEQESQEKISNSLRSVSEHQAFAEILDAVPELSKNKDFSKYVAEYKSLLSELDAKHKRLDELNTEWRAIKFVKGKRSDAARLRLEEIKKQTAAINGEIASLDRRLLEIASLRSLRTRIVDVYVKRQKNADRKELSNQLDLLAFDLKERHKRVLSEYRENVKTRAQREKVVRVIKDINTYLIKNTKDKHVPSALRKQFANVMSAFNLDWSAGENKTVEDYLLKIQKEYEKIAGSSDPAVGSMYDSDVDAEFARVIDLVEETSVHDMNQEQLDAVYNLFKRMRKMITSANQLRAKNMSTTAQQVAYSSMDQLKAAKKKERHEPGGKVGKYIEQRTFDDLKPIYFFSRLGSPTMQKLFQNILEGQYVYANDIREAEEFITALNEKYKAKKWKADDKFTFTDAAGESFQLTRREVWDIYAHSRREQSRKHLLEHGIVLSEAREVDEESAKGVLKKRKYRINDTRNHPLSEVVIGDILSDKVISKEEKAYVEELQKYLSVDLAKKGNEVSLAMYDVALYGEKNYWPIKTAKWYNEFDPQGKGNPSIATPNHSKGVAKYAASPIMINDALTTWNQHVHDMAAYHGMAIPVSDFTRVVNAKTLKDQTNVGGVRQTLEELYGPAPGRYIAQLLKDLNGNMVLGIDDTFVDMGITMSKKAAVMMSLSVAIQQPSSIMRATPYIKPKYLVSRKKYEGMTVGNVMERWKQLCKIAPVAYIKEMGGYDTGLGRTATEHLRKLEGKQVKDIINDIIHLRKPEGKQVRDTINDIMGFLPSFMDKITWLRLYDGAVAQVTDEAAQRNENLSKEEIEKRAVALFNETIEKTQVYDSTLTRSGIMRKPGAGTKAITAFGAEPTVSTNMMSDAIVRARRGEPGAKKMLAKTFGAVISAAFVNALLKAIVTAPRDDDENEMLYEKYIGNVLNSFIVDAFVFTNVPVVRDVVSTLQGFSVDRMDWAVFQDIFDRWEKVFKGDLKWVEVVDALVELFSLTPVPLRNLWRDLKGANNFVLTLMKDISGENKPTWTGLGIAVKDSIPILPDTSKQNALYMAYASGRQGDIQYFRSQYASATAANTAIKTALRKNDPDVREAATLRYNGNVERSAALVNKIAKRTNVPLELVQEAVMSEVKKMQDNAKPTEENYDGEEDTSTSTPGTYTTTDLKLALEQGRNAAPIVEAIIADKTANGATRNQARNQVRQSAWGAYKSAYYDAYKSGNKSEMDRIKKILLGTKLWTESELKNTLSNFIKNKEEE
jgi:hypothetical protein